MSNINIPTQVSPFASFSQFPAIGKTRVIYIDQATNIPYYWNVGSSSYISLAGVSSVEWGDITGSITSQTDLQNALNNKVDKVTGKGLSTNDYTTAEKNKLAGIQAGAEVNVNADWNATTGDAVILNKPTIPTAVTKTSDLTNDGADGINPFITANDIPTFASADKMVTVGRNATGQTLYKGTIVYISGSTGNRPNFVKSQANGESTSAGTFGVIENDIPNNSDGNCVTIGTIDNLDTRSTATHPFTNDTLADGDTIYLSPTTAGFVTKVKPSAPNHLVYVGKVVRTSPTNGTIVYRIQNGYELDEIHDVTTTDYTTPQDVDSLLILDDSTSLWKRLTWANVKAKLKTYFDTLYQAILVSGTNIKTINGSSVLGSGDLVVSGGGGLQGIQIPFNNIQGSTSFGFNAMINSGNVANVAVSSSRLEVYPFTPNKTLNNCSLTINVTTLGVGVLARIVIYSDLDSFPNTKLYESTDINCSTTGDKVLLANFTFNAGTTYWIGFYTNGVATFRAMPISALIPLFSPTSGSSPIVAWARVSTPLGTAPSTFSYNTYSQASQVIVYIRPT